MSEIFRKLDKNFEHILIHTGQHFDFGLSEVFFKDLKIRKPDYNWGIGQTASDHFEQLAHLILKIKEHEQLLKSADLVLFLGDSNSVLASIPIAKLGIKIGHIEAGMRSGDRRMFEEINRVVCDHCSSLHFCYHDNYAQNLINENLNPKGIHVTGNTIVEVVKQIIPEEDKKNCNILVDIHRPENFLDKNRLINIIDYVKYIGNKYDLPVSFLNFKRTVDKIKEWNINMDGINITDLMSFPDYISAAYHSKIIISDSGTAQEELAFLKTPVLVPRDFTERPESTANGCSVMIDVNSFNIDLIKNKLQKCEELGFKTKWLGNGTTSDCIIDVIKGLK